MSEETCDSAIGIDFDAIHCDLPKGHKGKHEHKGTDWDQNIEYLVTWE